MIRLNNLSLAALLSIPTFSFASELPKKSDGLESKSSSGISNPVEEDLENDAESDDELVLREGDRIKIKLIPDVDDDPMASIKLAPMVWAISTYSLHEHKFSEDLVYQIKKIKYGIPMAKGKGMEINETNPPLIAELEPLGLKPDPYRRVFWYLDLNKGVLAQHEDGSTIAEIESVTLM